MCPGKLLVSCVKEETPSLIYEHQFCTCVQDSNQRPGICAVGDFIHSSPSATAAERRTKVEILF